MFTLILIGILTFLLFVFFKIKFNYWHSRGIEGPTPIPFFGTILTEISLPPRELEEKFLRDYGPIFGTYMSTKPILNISVEEHIKTVLNDHTRFHNLSSIEFNDKYLQNSIFFKNKLDWKTARAAQTHYFTSKRFKDLFEHFKIVASNFLENLATEIKKSKTGDIEIKRLSKYYGVDIIAKVLFAIDCDAYKERDTIFVKSAMNIGNINSIQSILVAILPKSISLAFGLRSLTLKPMNDLGDHFKKLLRQRKQSGIKYGDLSELLQQARDENKVQLSEDEFIGNILLSFFAGIEPTVNATVHMFYFLAHNPHVQEKLYNEIKKQFNDEINYEKLTQNEYLDAVLSETLRLGSSVFLQTRTAIVDTQLGDLKIDKNTEIRLISCLPHLSSDNYLDPRTFNPDRFLKGSIDKRDDALFIPFGSGKKTCLGQRLARLEVKYLFVRVLQKYEICKAKDLCDKRTFFRGFMVVDNLNVAFKERI